MMSNFGISVKPVRNPKNKICRTCLKQRMDMKSIFNSEVNSVPVYQMFSAAIPIEIKADDGLPGYLCSQCIQSLINVYKFQKMCIDNDFKLRNYITVFHSNPGTIEDADINFEHMPSGNTKNDKAEVYELADDAEIVVKIDSDDDDDVNNFEVGNQPIEQLQAVPTANMNAGSLQRCESLTWSPDNDAIQLDERDYFSQEQNEWNDLFCCSICYARFETKEFYDSHMQMHGTKPRPLPKPIERKLEIPVLKTVYLCNICKTAFGTEHMLNLHKKVHERPRPRLNEEFIQRGKINMTFSRYNCTTQSKTSNEKSVHVCNICKKSFKTWEELTQHISEHQIKILYGTEQGSNTTVNVNVNIQTEKTTEKTYDCKTCNKTFNGAEELSLHEKEHIATENIPAITANPMPEKKSNEINNQITNTYLLAYNARKKALAAQNLSKCKYCERILSNSSNLRRHIRRQHPNEKEHVDPPKDPLQIDDELSSSPVVEQPKKLVLYRCEVCDHEFDDKTFFLTHKKLHLIEEILNEKEENQPLPPDVETEKLPKAADVFQIVCSAPKPEILSMEADKESDAEPTYTEISSKIAEIKKEEIKEFKCLICSKIFPHRKNMLCHMPVHKLSFNGKNYACSICKEVFSSISEKELKEHNEKHAIQKPSEPVVSAIQCLVCPRTFQNRAFMISTHLPKHKILSDGITFSCSICNEKFDSITPDQYKEHSKKHAPEETEVEPRSLDIKRTSRRKFQLRKRKRINRSLVYTIAHGETKCHVCSYVYVNRHTLKRHLRTIHKINAQFNTYRGTAAPIKKLLRQKFNRNNINEESSKNMSKRRSSGRSILKRNDPRYKCDFCQKVFLNKSSLNRHKRTHGQNEMPVLIPIYAETRPKQSQPNNKQNNKSVITNQRQYECKICKFVATRKLILKRHMTIKHPGKSMKVDSKWKFQCEQCSRIFTRAFHLQRHVYDYHETDPPRRTKREISADSPQHECSICSAVLQTPSYRRHMREKHGKLIKDSEKQYCRDCDLYLEDKEHLQSHILKVHTT